MDFNLSINMDNAWFNAESEIVLAHTLNGVQSRICAGETCGKILDGNGNTCGQWDIRGVA